MNTNIEKKPFISWDTTDILNAQAKHLVETGEAEHEEQGWTIATEDPFLLDDEWNGLLFALTEKLDEINPEGYWHCEVENFGWRNLNGYKDFSADNSQAFLAEILPNTDCTFHIYIDDLTENIKVIKIENYHHDSPTGEWYTITAIDAEAFDMAA